MKQDCIAVKLGQSCRRGRPLHALSVVHHSSYAGEPPLHLPEVSLHLVALVVAHDGVDGPHPPAPHASQGPAPHLASGQDGGTTSNARRDTDTSLRK